MADNDLLEIHRQHRAGQEKYTYFLLTITGAATAFAIQKADGEKISLPLILLGLAILAWGISFYFGIKNIIWVQTSIQSNFNLLQLQKGLHPKQPDANHVFEYAIKTTTEAIESNINKALGYGKWQFRLLITGVVFLIAWRVLEMVLLTWSP